MDRVQQCDAIARRIASGEWDALRGGTEILLLMHDTENVAQERMAAAIQRVSRRVPA